MTKERIQWLDNLKGLLIITVVLGHCIQHTFSDGGENVVFRYIYSFHMMLFMFVSGYACYRPNVEWKLVGRRAKQLLIPFLVWSLVLCAIRGEFQLFDMILKPEKSFWFLWALFFITLFHVLACRMAERLRWKDELTSLVFGVLLLGFAAVTHINYFAIQLVAFHFVFYTLGFYCHKYDVIKKIPIWAIISSFICWFVMAWFWAGSKPIHQLEYQNTVLTIAIHFITALVGIIAFVPAVQCWLNRKSLILNEIGGGGGTLAIYVVHLSLLSLLPDNRLGWVVSMPDWLYIILLTVIIIGASYGIYRLLRINKIIAFLFIGK